MFSAMNVVLVLFDKNCSWSAKETNVYTELHCPVEKIYHTIQEFVELPFFLHDFISLPCLHSTV